MDFDLITLRLFDAAVRLGSISAAAEEQHIAVSAVSRRFADLEHRLGTAVLYRKVRGVEPTPAGQVLLRHARNILRLTERAADELADHAEGRRGHVRVAANPSAIAEFLPPLFASFREAYPEIRIALREQMSDAIVRDVTDGQADLGIFSAVVPHAGLEVVSYRRDRLCVVVAKGHRLAGRAQLKFADIVGEPYVALEDGSSLASQFETLAAEAGATAEPAVRVRSFEGVRRMVGRGLGLGVLPLAVVEPYAESDGLTAVALAEPWAERQFLIGMRERAALTRAAERFLSHLLCTRNLDS